MGKNLNLLIRKVSPQPNNRQVTDNHIVVCVFFSLWLRQSAATLFVWRDIAGDMCWVGSPRCSRRKSRRPSGSPLQSLE